MAICENCGCWFHDGGENWKTLCLSCWKRQKRQGTGETPLQYWKARCQRAESLLLDTEPAPAKIPDELRDHLKMLIFFCHPDKHGNDARATVCTQYLLSLREALK